MDTTRQVVLNAAADLLTGFLDPEPRPGWRAERTQALKPREEDYRRVFVGYLAELAERRYSALWVQAPVIEPGLGQVRLEIAVALADELAADGPAADQFPGGYRDIAGLLIPGVFWAVWQFQAPGEVGGMQFDGLAYLDGRFAWFPKPWRVLGQSG